MTDPTSPPQEAQEALEALIPAGTPEDASLRVKLVSTRDKIIHGAATNLIRLGNELPQLKKAGYWLYGAATRYLPQGREVDKLGEVGEKVYRGAQPSMRAFETLQELGVDTVINLRPESDYERKIVAKLGMNYMYMPLPPLDKPTHDVTIDFLRAVTDPENGVVFFHCFHGVDRTGTMAACLRIARDDWSVDDALEEMRAYKVHESGQRAKVVYLQEFCDFWHALPLAERCEILHRPLPEAPAAEPAPALPWWKRAVGWVKTKVAGLLEETGG
jgi:protein tyrosine phosphatase (PTP) superfamily phosphohydrolase (DUF442 family)